MAQLCAISYVIQLEEIERMAGVAYQAAALARAQGAKVDLPDIGAMRAQFDTWLMEDPKDIDPTAMIKMRALGVSKGR